MIINGITIENWAGIRNPLELKFSDGLNIIHGPNEVGKTTVVDSIRTILFSKHTSSSDKIKSIIPWGSNLAPKASISFSLNESRYRITKKFISSNMSLLEKLANNKWERIAEGDDADNKVLELIGGQFPGRRGDTKPEYWGTGQALWMVQGIPFISEKLNDETVTSLQKLIGKTIEESHEKKLFKSIDSWFLAIFTGVRREYKKGSDLDSIQSEIMELEEKKAYIDDLRNQKEGFIKTADQNEYYLKQENDKLKKLRDEKVQLKEKVNEAQNRRIQREKLGEKIKRIKNEYETKKEKIDSIKDKKNEIVKITDENKNLVLEKDDIKKEFDEIKQKIRSRKSEIQKLKSEIKSNDNELKFTRIAYDAIIKEIEIVEKKHLLEQNKFKLKGNKDLIQKIKKLKDKLNLKEEEYEKINAPSRKEFENIFHKYNLVQNSKSQLEASGLATTVFAKSDFSGKITLDGEDSSFKMNKDEEKKWISQQKVRIQIENIGDIQIIGGSGKRDINEQKRRYNDLQKIFNDAIAPFEIKDIEKLRELSNLKEDTLDEIEKLKSELERYEQSDKIVSEEEIKELNDIIVDLKNKSEANWNRIPKNFDLLKYKGDSNKLLSKNKLSKEITEIESKKEQLEEKFDNISGEYEEFEEHKDDIQERFNNSEKIIDGNDKLIKQIKSQLDKLQKDGYDVNEMEKQFNQLSKDIEQKEHALEQYEKEIEDFEEKPLEDMESCERTINALQESLKDREKENAEISGELHEMFINLRDANKIEEEIEYLKEGEKKLLIKAKAIELLYDIIHFYKERTIASLSTPLHKIMAKDFESFFGKRYGQLQFDNGMKPIKVEVPNWGVEAPIESLSFGTKEQIWFLFRLCLGQLLSRDEKQLVVLDDPLANTDEDRLKKALKILEKKSDDVQIIIITCDVNKYKSVSKVNLVPIKN